MNRRSLILCIAAIILIVAAFGSLWIDKTEAEKKYKNFEEGQEPDQDQEPDKDREQKTTDNKSSDIINMVDETKAVI